MVWLAATIQTMTVMVYRPDNFRPPQKLCGGQGHHSLGHIKSAQGDGPLDCSNEGLAPLDVMWSTQRGII